MAITPSPLDRIRRDVLTAFGFPDTAVPTLAMPPATPMTTTTTKVYLDTNHWISLAKARVGHADGERHRECYEALLDVTVSGELCVVLSSANYMELQLAVKGARQRTDLADIMSELTRFHAIRPRSELLEAQVMQRLHDTIGRPAFPSRPEPFGLGFAWIFNGRTGRLGLEAPPQALQVLFNEANGSNTLLMLAQAQEMLEYMILRGSAAGDPADMPVLDLDPIRAVEIDRVQSFRNLELQLAEDPRLVARLDDILIARELYWEIGPELGRLLYGAGLSVDSFFYKGKDWLTDFVEGLPTIAVQLAVREQNLRGASRPWKVNDQRDIDHLGVAVPYCDVTVTDKAAANAIRRAGLDQQFGHTVLDDLSSLLTLIQAM